jgi:hypothetical protein
MVEIASSSDISEKWTERASGAQSEFESGVGNTSTSEQQDATLNATAQWEQGVQNSISNGTFQSGVEDPNKDWQDATLEIGGQRFSQGVRASTDAFEQGFEPFRDTIESLTLSARGPRGDVATNIERVREVATALADQRQQG